MATITRTLADTCTDDHDSTQCTVKRQHVVVYTSSVPLSTTLSVDVRFNLSYYTDTNGAFTTAALRSAHS